MRGTSLDVAAHFFFFVCYQEVVTMTMLEAILKNPAFYAAIIALLNALVDYFLPDFPRDIRTAVNGLLAVIFASITGVAIVRAIQARNAAKEARLK